MFRDILSKLGAFLRGVFFRLFWNSSFEARCFLEECQRTEYISAYLADSIFRQISKPHNRSFFINWCSFIVYIPNFDLILISLPHYDIIMFAIWIAQPQPWLTQQQIWPADLPSQVQICEVLCGNQSGTCIANKRAGAGCYRKQTSTVWLGKLDRMAIPSKHGEFCGLRPLFFPNTSTLVPE